MADKDKNKISDKDRDKILLDFIASGEGDYDMAFGGKRYDLTNMTVKQVRDLQKKLVKEGSPSSAMGRYQFMGYTLDDFLKNKKLKDTDKFDIKTQDRLALELANRRGYQKFISGDISYEDFQNNLAKEWASIPTTEGNSYYDKDGLNKANKTLEQTRRMLMNLRGDDSFPPPISSSIEGNPNNIETEPEEYSLNNSTNNSPASPEMLNALANSGQRYNVPVEESIDNPTENYDLNSRGRLDSFYGISEPTINPQDTEALASNQGNPDMNQAKFGGLQLTNRFENGGLINEFNEGGKHEENPIGGIPQGIGSNGNLNTVEEGETKFGNYVFSDTLKLSKEDINSLFLPKKLEGKTYAEASKYLNDFIEDDPSNNITKKTIKRQLDSLILGNEKAKSLYQDNNLDITNQNQMFLGGSEVDMSEDAMGFDISDPNAPSSPATLNSNGVNLAEIGNTASGLLSGVNQVESVLNQDDPDNVSVGKTALSMAATGAGIGSVIPGVGTAIGAGVGAIGGLVSGLFGKRKARKRARQKEIKDAQNLQNSNLELFREGGPLTGLGYMGEADDSFIPETIYNLNDPILKNMWGLNNTSYNGPENNTRKPITPVTAHSAPAVPIEDLVGFGKNTEPWNTERIVTDVEIPKTGYKFSKGVHPLQYTNVLGSYLNYRDARKLKPEVETLNRLNTRISPYLVDEQALINNARNTMNTSINAITNASGGSEGAVRAGILASGLNYNRGLSEATLQAQNYNNSQRLSADQMNLRTDQFNIGQDNQEKDINARNRAMVRNAKQEARAALFDSISGVGKELTYDRRIRALTGGYDNSTYNPEQRNMMLDYLKFLQK